jgi:2-keto-myo-inositol isomerase
MTMALGVIRFSLNRTVAPRLPLDGFLKLARKVGVEAIEIRNDIEDQEFANGMSAVEARQRIAEQGLKVASINALQRFNDWTPDREHEAKGLFAYAAALGAPGIVLCPVVEAGHGWGDAELARKLREALRAIKAIASDHGVIGYVEPLGMVDSTLRSQSLAVEAIEDVGGAGPLQLCYDTFQFYRASDVRLFPQHIGLVHVSGITRTDLAREELTEPDRGFVDTSDICGTIGQLRAIRAAGYGGYVSMEPFDPAIQGRADVSEELGRSLDHLRQAQ